VLSLYRDDKTCRFCQQPLQEHHKICTVLASNPCNTTKVAQFLPGTLATPQKLHSSCQQPWQHHKSCTVLASNLCNTTKVAQFLPATLATPQKLHSSCQQPLQHHKSCTVLASNPCNITKLAQLMSAAFYPTPCMPDKKKFVPLAYTQDPANWARSDPMAK